MAGKRHSISVFELMSSQAATGASTGVSSDATNNGVLSVVGYDQVAIQLGGGGSTYAATVNFQVTVDGATWLDKFAMSATDNALNDSVANDSGIHIVPVTGMSGFRLNLSAHTDGSVTGFARATVGGGNLSFADIELSTALVTSDLADSDVLLFGNDTTPAAVGIDASTDATFGNALMVAGNDTDDGLGVHWFTGDSVILPADEIADPTLLMPGLSFPMIYDGTAWQRQRSVNQQSIDSVSVSTATIAVSALGYALDDSGTMARVKSNRYDTDGLAAVSSDLAETLSVINFLYGYEATAAVWNRVHMDTAARLHVTETWNSTLQVEETADVQDKTFSVPADLDWQVMWLWVEYTSDANAGNRQITVQVRDSADDVIMQFFPGLTQAENLVYHYLFAPGAPDLTSVRGTDNFVSTPIPENLIIPELFDVRVFDGAVITGGDTAGETAIVQMMVMDRARVDT